MREENTKTLAHIPARFARSGKRTGGRLKSRPPVWKLEIKDEGVPARSHAAGIAQFKQISLRVPEIGAAHSP